MGRSDSNEVESQSRLSYSRYSVAAGCLTGCYYITCHISRPNNLIKLSLLVHRLQCMPTSCRAGTPRYREGNIIMLYCEWGMTLFFGLGSHHLEVKAALISYYGDYADARPTRLMAILSSLQTSLHLDWLRKRSESVLSKTLRKICHEICRETR